MLSRTPLAAALVTLLLCVTTIYYLGSTSGSVREGFSRVLSNTGHYVKGGSSFFGFSTVRDEPPEVPPYGAVVAAARGDEDLSWMNDQLFQKKCVIPSNPIE